MLPKIQINLNRIENKIRKYTVTTLKMVMIIGFCYVILYPLISMVFKSVMFRDDLFDRSVILIPKNFTLENFKIASILLFYQESLKNSLLVSAVSSFLQVCSCVLTGYAFGRYTSKLRNILFVIVIVTIIIPPQLIMLPMFMQFRYFDIFGIFEMITGEPINLIGRFAPFWLLSATGMGIRSGLFIFIFRQFFRNMPKEIEEAAIVDGANTFRTFFSVMLPNAVTSMVTVALFSFVWQYNDVTYSTVFFPFGKLLPLLYRNLERLTPEVFEMLGMSGSDATMMFYVSLLKSTGVLMVIAPVVLIFIIFQRYFVESVERSGITGQ